MVWFGLISIGWILCLKYYIGKDPTGKNWRGKHLAAKRRRGKALAGKKSMGKDRRGKYHRVVTVKWLVFCTSINYWIRIIWSNLIKYPNIHNQIDVINCVKKTFCKLRAKKLEKISSYRQLSSSEYNIDTSIAELYDVF